MLLGRLFGVDLKKTKACWLYAAGVNTKAKQANYLFYLVFMLLDYYYCYYYYYTVDNALVVIRQEES